MLGEKVTTEISKKEKPKSMPENKKVASRGGQVAGNARKETEKELEESESISRSLFIDPPTPTWHLDLSRVKKAIDILKGNGINNFSKYLEEDPNLIDNAIKLLIVKVHIGLGQAHAFY